MWAVAVLLKDELAGVLTDVGSAAILHKIDLCYNFF